MGTDTVTATSAAGTAIITAIGTVTGTGTNLGWIAQNMAFIVCISLVVIAILIGGSIAFSTFYSMKKNIVNLELLRLYFAMGILIGLGLLFAFAKTVYVWGPTNSSGSGKEVFDACVKVIPHNNNSNLRLLFWNCIEKLTRGFQARSER